MILARNKLHASQRVDKETLEFLLSQARADSKYFIKNFWSPGTYILNGFKIIGTAVGAITIEQADSALINASNTGAYSYFAETPTASNLTVTTAQGLTYNARNYIELTLTTEDGTPLSLAFWSGAANAGAGLEFAQIVNTVTNLKVTVSAQIGSFSAGDDTIPVAICDVDAGGNIVTTFDRRDLFFRLGIGTDADNEYTWSQRVDPEITLNFSGLAGAFVVGETITFNATETAVVTDITGMAGGSIKVNQLSADTYSIGDALAGAAATATLDTSSDDFEGADKDITSLKQLLNAIMTEIKLIKGTDFWFSLSSSSISGLNSFINSIISPISAGAKVSWDGTHLSISDSAGAPADADVVARIRMFASTQEFDLTRQDGAGGSATLAIADNEVLYVTLPATGDRAFSAAGAGATNYKVVALGSFSPTDYNYWLAFREGGKLFFRGVGELETGESSQIGDNIPVTLLDALGLANEVDMPTYTSNIRGVAAEGFLNRISALTDAIGDEQEDRSAFWRSDDVVVWDGASLSFTSDLELKILNTQDGNISTHVVLVAGSPITLADGEIAYVVIDRTLAGPGYSENNAVTIAASLPVQSQANKEVIPLFQRIDAGGAGYLHIPLHKQVLEPGQSVRLGASGSGSGGGSAFGLLLDALPYRCGFKDTFENQNLIDSSETTAIYSAAVKAFGISYDAGVTATTTAAALELNAAPAFTVVAGDIIWATITGNVEIRKITDIGSLNADGGSGTPATLEAAFSSDLAADACCVSQVVQTVDAMNYYNSTDDESHPNSELVGHILLSAKAVNNFDHAENPDWLTPQANDIILQYTGGVLYESYITAIVDADTFTLNDASNLNNGNAYIIRPLASYLVSYNDSGWSDMINVGYSAITGVDSAANWAAEYGFLRPQNFADDIEKVTLSGTPGGHFFLRFFANKAVGDGMIILYEYDSAFYEESDYNNGGIHNQAYCRTDGAGTEVNCVVSTPADTRITLADDFPSFVSGVNSGNPFGDLEVYLDGKEIPRYTSAALTPNASYTEDANGLYIELDQDYSGSSLSVSLKRRIGTIDTSDDNSTEITKIKSFLSGCIFPFGGTTAPIDSLACNGATIGNPASGATHAGNIYEDLFDIIKVGWGNTGAEVFADGDTVLLPDLRGMFLRGAGSHGTLNMANGNDFAGPAVGASENDQFQQWQGGFTHDVAGARDYWAHSADRDTSTVAVEGAGATFTPVRVSTAAQGIRAFKAMSDGTYGTPRQGDETRPVNYGVLYIIKI